MHTFPFAKEEAGHLFRGDFRSPGARSKHPKQNARVIIPVCKGVMGAGHDTSWFERAQDPESSELASNLYCTLKISGGPAGCQVPCIWAECTKPLVLMRVSFDGDASFSFSASWRELGRS